MCKHIIAFLHVFLIEDLHHANIFFSKKSLLFFRNMIWVSGDVGIVYGDLIDADLLGALDESQQLENAPSVRFFIAESSDVVLQ